MPVSAPPSKSLLRRLEAACLRYQGNLTENGDAVTYLQLRGLPWSAVVSSRLGVVDGREGSEHPEYAGWLSIPYLTRAGVVSFKFRRFDDGSPKYIGPYETRLFNTVAMDEADKTGTLAICEGEIDALTLTYLCGIPAVGVPGAQAYKAHPEWRGLFDGYTQVLIFQDDDDPGKQLAQQLHSDIASSRIVRLPSADVNECYMSHGAEGVRKAAGLGAQ